MVPKDKVTRLRMKLAESNLPKGGGVGYEIFDKSDALGTTSFVQNINHLRALEGELARTIRAIDRIQLPASIWCCRNGPFARETPEPSASIVVRVRGSLEPQQIRAIRHVVASAVNGPSRSACRSSTKAAGLADSASKEAEIAVGEAPHRLREAHAQRGRGDRLLGGRPGSRPRPAHRRLRLQQDHPDLGQVRSRRPRAALQPDPRGSAATAENNGQVAVNNELPGNQAIHRSCGPRPEQEERRDQQLRNFLHHQDRGHRGRTSIGSRSRCWSTAPIPRTKKAKWSIRTAASEQLDRIATLVRSAIGFDQKRGVVEVVNLRFAEAPAVPPVAEASGLLGMLQFTKDDVMYVIELGVMMLLGLVVLFMVIRPLVKRILASEVVPGLESWCALTRAARRRAGPARP